VKIVNSFHFTGQKEGEQILLIVRRHWFNIFQNLFAVLIMVLLLFVSYFYLPFLFPIFQSDAYNSLFMFLENLFAMIVWILFFLVWIDYYFDVWIVTNKRVVNVEQKGLFSREVSELEFEKIQDVTTEVLGIIPTFLNYGNVCIQTAGEKEHFTFADVADPYRIKDLIMNLQKELQRKERSELGSMLRREIKKDESE
jgi:uncharacterized membrane protein YdbT with pleckstrin-like domain